MKYTGKTSLPCISFVLLFLFSSAASFGQTVTIPDLNFKKALVEAGVDKNKDGEIQESEALGITNIDVSKKSISTLEGIAAFRNLNNLDCDDNDLTSLDLKDNTLLATLSFSSNRLTSIDVSRNVNLVSISCGWNKLTSIDLSKNKELFQFLGNHNQFTTLNFDNNPLLETISCNNNLLTSIDISPLTVLNSLSCENNQLTNLDVSKNKMLAMLYCGGNEFRELDISHNESLTVFDCTSSPLLAEIHISPGIKPREQWSKDDMAKWNGNISQPAKAIPSVAIEGNISRYGQKNMADKLLVNMEAVNSKDKAVSFFKMKLEEYERSNRAKGSNSSVDTIVSFYQRIWNDNDKQYPPTGVDYAFTFLLNPYNKLSTSGTDLRKAETILDHDINENYKEIIRDKDIIYPQSDYKYLNRGQKEEDQKALVCRMLEAKAGIEFLAGDIENAKATLQKENEVLQLRKDKFSKELQVYYVNMTVLSNRLNNADDARMYYEKSKTYVPDHFDPTGNLCLRFMHGNDEYYFQMNILGDKEMVVKEYLNAKQYDEDIAGIRKEQLKETIRKQEEMPAGYKRYLYTDLRMYKGHIDQKHDGQDVTEDTTSLPSYDFRYWNIEAAPELSFDEVEQRCTKEIWFPWLKDNDLWVDRYYVFDCEKYNCGEIIEQAKREIPPKTKIFPPVTWRFNKK